MSQLRVLARLDRVAKRHVSSVARAHKSEGITNVMKSLLPVAPGKDLKADIRAVLTHLRIDGAAIVGHDIGTMVAYAYAARYPDRTEKLVVMDAPIPGIPSWDEIVRNPLLWHFSFGGPDAERSAQEIGAAGFLQKPFGISELLTQVEALRSG